MECIRTGRFLFRWVTSALLLIIVAMLVPGVHVSIFGALLAAIVLGFFSAAVRPVLVVLTFPITIVTFGLFILVINAILFWGRGVLRARFFSARILGGIRRRTTLRGVQRRPALVLEHG